MRSGLLLYQPHRRPTEAEVLRSVCLLPTMSPYLGGMAESRRPVSVSAKRARRYPEKLEDARNDQ